MASEASGHTRDPLVDLASSTEYARAHLPSACFALHSRLDEVLSAAPLDAPIILVSPDAVLATYAAAEWEASSGRTLQVLSGGTRAWIDAGLAVDTGTGRFLSPPIDRYKRPYEGTDNPREAMQAYLDWEYGLVAQLQRDATHHFRVI